MQTDKTLQLPLSAVAEKIKSGELTSAELTRKMIDHARRVNDRTNAYISFREEEAMKEAEQADELIQKGEYRGVFHGIPMGIKDNIYLKGEVTTMGSKIHQDFIPDEEAEVVGKLKEAGVVIIGKHNLHEYAWGVTNDNPHFGPARNPWNPSKITGGSDLIPMGIKDNIYLKGEVTTMGSKIHQDFIPDEEAEVVGKLKEAGVVIIGKHNLHEYAWGVTNDNPHFGPARNPWNPSKITGG